MLKTAVLLLLCVSTAFCANILFVSPLPSPSHHIWNRALAFGLVERGHNVTLVGPDKDKVVPSNYTHIYIEGLYEDESYEAIDFSTYSPLEILFAMDEYSASSCQMFLKTNGSKQLSEYPKDFFDAIIFDVTGPVCFLGLIHTFQYPPTIAVIPFLLPSYVAYSYGNPLVPSYVPWHSLQCESQMNFIERLSNHFFTYFEVALKPFRQYSIEHKIMKKAFGEDSPPVEELQRHVSLVLANTDPILDTPQPLAPNFIPVGGLPTRPGEKLPQDLQKILDGAKHGAIIFSLGSNVRSDKLTPNTQKALINAFGQINQTVIWKFESELENAPENLIIRKWLPQNDLLAHPNVRLLIGHGGALSTHEAIYHGVPIVCIPIFMDQFINCKTIGERKLGVSLDFNKLTTDNVLQGLREVLDNPMYAKNIKNRSKIFRDRPETPLERGIFWTEYVLRHGGAQFLSTPARDLPFYVTYSLDIMLFFIVVVILLVVVINKIFQLVFKLFVRQEKLKIN